MKLKKIASLMLAGIMAVSMLAGCEGKSDNNEEKNPVVPVTSDIVTWANDALDGKAKGVFKFESDAKVDEALKAVATDSTKYGSADIAAAMSNMTFAGAYDEDLSDELMDKLGLDQASQSWFSNVTVDGKDKVVGYVYVLSDKLTEKAAIEVVADGTEAAMTSTNFPTSKNNYNVDYSADISAVKVTAPDNAKHSVWVIATVITQTATEASNATT